MWDFRLFPEQASTYASEVDLLFFVLIGISSVITIGVAAFIVNFVVKYRHTAIADRSGALASTSNIRMEVSWIVILTVLGLGMFTWAGVAYVEIQSEPPGEALEIYGIGKQWMWKFQHPTGAREINHLHVPVGRPVRMVLTSQDVIHSFYIPAFRTKMDVVPGRYTNVWFEATKPGRYHLFCAEFCGTEHAYMDGYVYAMEPEEYEEWLYLGDADAEPGQPGYEDLDRIPGTGRFERTPPGTAEPPFSPGPWRAPLPDVVPDGEPETRAMAIAGSALFRSLRCNSCHRVDSTALYPGQGPLLVGVYGRTVILRNNREIIADEQYLRESILYPQAKLVQGYPAIMPTYKGQISEEELMQLIAYLKTLGRVPAVPELPGVPIPEAEEAPAAEEPEEPAAAGSVASGRELFTQFACNTCHRVDPDAAGPTLCPSLVGLFGRTVTLQTGETLTADEAYIRESILHADRMIVAGYQPIMPVYAGQITDEEVQDLVAYIRSLE